ncbi:SgcJ/EcaC family oxidoreductase [bacterium]|nr:SgcJ/EcaC family oxidoreductase [bacterium]
MKKMVCALFVLALLSSSVGGQRPSTTPASEAEAAVIQMARDYEKAFNAGDAIKLGQMFAEDVEYTDEDGVLTTGRDAITALLKQAFARDPGAKMTIQIQSVRSISPDVAIERGETLTTSRGGEQSPSAYTAVHVRGDGKWQIKQMTESPVPAPSANEMLSGLAWMVGTWTERDGDAQVETKVNWARGGNFLTRNFNVTIGGEPTMQGWQIIGWDPVAKRIRSWTFDTEGGFQDGTWTRTGNSWSIRQTGYTPDGSTFASQNLMQRVGDGKCTWENVNRTLDGDPQPSLPRVEMNRAQERK